MSHSREAMSGDGSRVALPTEHSPADDGFPGYPRPDPDRLTLLAAHGSRTPGLNHDLASQSQQFMLAVDRMLDLVDASTPSQLRNAIESAEDTINQFRATLDESRMLVRPRTPAPVALDQLLKTAGMRSTVSLEPSEHRAIVTVAVASASHALTLILGALTEDSHRGSVGVTVVASDARDGAVDIRLCPSRPAPKTATAACHLALARRLLTESRATLRATDDGVEVTLVGSP